MDPNGMAIGTPPVSGIDLLVARRTAGLTQDAVAARMGVNRSRVSHLELLYRVPRTAVERYMAALRRGDE
jgi:transcriptional regulator with XRE-family HTH domain